MSAAARRQAERLRVISARCTALATIADELGELALELLESAADLERDAEPRRGPLRLAEPAGKENHRGPGFVPLEPIS
jgi:hypothetical protein